MKPAADGSGSGNGHGQASLASLVLGAIGVVYGDIGTSPLYTMKEVFTSAMSPTPANIMGILSMIVWAMMISVTFKYILVITRANNRGEGGVLVLSNLARRGLSSKWKSSAVLLGLFGMALFLGDSLITPAMSVLSAMEGINVAAPSLSSYVIPATLVVIVGLFVVQFKGTGKVGKFFGPVMIMWFMTLAILGVSEIVHTPGILWALSPTYALAFVLHHGFGACCVLGSIVLAVTGGEALYADMGHFGRKPIALSWSFFVLPCLAINYFGQGAELIAHPEAVASPLYMMAPSWATWPMLILAAFATIIASQAVISGAFSLTQQAVQLDYLPRRNIRYTSDESAGQVYIPRTNWTLMVGVVLLVLTFQSSTNLASAYGISVVGAMTIDSLLAMVVARTAWKWSYLAIVPVFGLFLFSDLAFLATNLVKIPEGGWFPILIASLTFFSMFVWRKGRRIVFQANYRDSMPVDDFVSTQVPKFLNRTPGTAVFLTSNVDMIPSSFLHNMKHNGAMHERVVFMKIKFAEAPYLSDDDRVDLREVGNGFYKVVFNVGFMETPTVTSEQALLLLEKAGLSLDVMGTSYFLARETLKPTKGQGLNCIEEKLFMALANTAGSPSSFFDLPPNRVLEIGVQVEI